MSWWQAIILGLVEGLTEYLPISSTGHLILASELIGLDAQSGDTSAYLIVIQGGAILAVLGLYRVRILQMLRGIAGRDPDGRRLFINLLVAFLPAAILAPGLNDRIEDALFHPGPVIAALALGGIVMIGLTSWQKRFFHDAANEDDIDSHTFVDIEHLTWRRALIIGLLQCIAMWPGTSRSMMTIIGGMLVGLRPRQAAEFSFLLGLPTLGGACAYKLVTDGPDMVDGLGLGPLVFGFIVATIAAAIAVKWLVAYLSKHGLAIFGWYRIALCIVLGVLVWRGVVTF